MNLGFDPYQPSHESYRKVAPTGAPTERAAAEHTGSPRKVTIDEVGRAKIPTFTTTSLTSPMLATAPAAPTPAAPAAAAPTASLRHVASTILPTKSYDYMTRFFSCKDQKIIQALDIELNQLIAANPYRDLRSNLGKTIAYCHYPNGMKINWYLIKFYSAEWVKQIPIPSSPFSINTPLPFPANPLPILVIIDFHHDFNPDCSISPNPIVLLYGSLLLGCNTQELRNRIAIRQLAEQLLGLPVTKETTLMEQFTREVPS